MQSSAPVEAAAAAAAATQPPLPSVNVVMCDSAHAIAAAVTVLLRSASVAVDLEGVDLGRTGEICVIQLVSSDDPLTVYIVDVTVLGGELLFGPQPPDGPPSLRAVLEHENIKKLFWDARKDINALFFHFQVSIPPSSVVDLQLYDSAFRSVSEGVTPRSYGSLGFVLEKLNHLALSEAECEFIRKTKEEAKSLFLPELGGSYQRWKERPLPRVLLDYATDARYFFPLLEFYRKRCKRHFDAAIKTCNRRRLRQAQQLEYGEGDFSVYRSVDTDFGKAMWKILVSLGLHRPRRPATADEPPAAPP